MLASDCPILFTSSMTVYGATRDRPFREEDGGQPKSAYGVGKWHAELLLSKYGSSSLAIRLPGLFGQARRSGLIYNVLSAYKQGVTLPKLPDEPVLWSALHVNDAAVGVTKLALGVITDNQAINLGYRGKIGVNSFLAIAAKLFSRVCINIKDQPEFEFELSRAEAMGVVPDKTFQEALQQFANEL